MVFNMHVMVAYYTSHYANLAHRNGAKKTESNVAFPPDLVMGGISKLSIDPIQWRAGEAVAQCMMGELRLV